MSRPPIRDRGFFFRIRFGDGAEYLVEAFNYSRACAIAAFLRVRDGSGDNHLTLAVAGGTLVKAEEARGALTIEDVIAP